MPPGPPPRAEIPIPPQMQGPGMPPMGPMPPDPMIGGMAPPPMQPPMEPPTNALDPKFKSKFSDFIMMLKQMVDQSGEEQAREMLKVVPTETLETIRTALANYPDELAFFENLIVEDDYSIEYPIWFVPPEKPTKTTIMELAEMDYDDWQPVRQRIRQDLDLYHQLISAAAPDRPTWMSPSMSDEARTIIAMLGTIDPSYEVPWKKPELENETQIAEDALYCFDDESWYEYQQAGNGKYTMDVAEYLVLTGYVMQQQVISLDGDYPTFRERLLSPENTVPTWDSRGLSRVTRKYMDTVNSVIADYDVDGEVAKKILESPKRVTDNGKSKDKPKQEHYRRSDEVEIIVYYDRWWMAVYADDVEIVPPTAHEYGFVPIVVQGSGIGEPVGLASESSLADSVDRTVPDNLAESQVVTIATGQKKGRRKRLEYKNVSWFHFRKRFHAQKEEILSNLIALLELANNPAYVIEQDDFARSMKAPDIKNKPGSRNLLKIGRERLSVLASDPSMVQVFGPVMNSIMQDEASNSMPKSAFGFFESANQSGNAMESSLESGREKVAPFMEALESFYSQRAAQRLTYLRDWGKILMDSRGSEGDEYGIVIQRQRTRRYVGESAAYITPETIRRTGVHVRAIMTHVRLQNLGPLGNAGSIWMGSNAMSAREMMTLRGVRDPDAVFAEIRYEKAMLDEGVQAAQTYQELVKRDPEAAMFYKDFVLGKMAASPGGGAGPSQGNFGAPNTSAMDLKAMGMGQEGPTGRPPGPDPSMMGQGTDVGP